MANETKKPSFFEEVEDKEKVRAEEDVIAYAETNKQDVKTEKVKKKESNTPAKPTQYIEGTDRLTGKKIKVELADVKALSRYIYVHNIFDPTPTIEAIRYVAIGSFKDVTMDITEELFEDMRVLPQFKNKVHFNYVDNMSSNDPVKQLFYHRTFSVKYPEWIKIEDVKKQAAENVSHYGVPDLKGIEKILWPDFTGKKQKPSLGPVSDKDAEDAVAVGAVVDEAQVEDVSVEEPKVEVVEPIEQVGA